MKRIVILPLFIICLSYNMYGQKEGLASIGRDDLKAYMDFFASDEMRGRETGSHENDIATLFLKSNAVRLGLKPIPETGDYLQKVPLVSNEIKRGETFIKSIDSKGTELFSTDSIVYLMPPMSTTETVSGLLFCGYGISDSARGYDDFKGLDLSGKIVMIMTGSPELTDTAQINSFFNMGIERNKIMTLFSSGAKAILMVYEPRSRFRDAFMSGLANMGAPTVGTKNIMPRMEGRPESPVQLAYITRYAADQLLRSSGKDLKTLQESIITGRQPVSFEVSDATVTFRTFIEKNEINPCNVIGIVEGSDPVLRNECIVYTAHFDHIGVNGNGESFNGADDNASGSMALLEVAQAFTALKKKPLRTVIFAWVNGEEKGLLGSQYYADHPVLAMDKTLMNINLDMVGRTRMASDTGTVFGFEVNVSGKDEILLYTDQKGKDILNLIDKASKTAEIKASNMGRDPLLGSSDYASFMDKGVPAIFLNSGDYPDLHTINDDVAKIDFGKMEKVSKMVFLIGYDLANQKKRFTPDTIPPPEGPQL